MFHQDQEMVYLYVTMIQVCSWDTTAITATHNALDSSGFKPCDCAFSTPIKTVFKAHPASYTMGTGSLSLGLAATEWHKAPTPI